MIDIHFLFTQDFDSSIRKEYRNYLNKEEKEKMGRFVFQKDRDQYLFTRILARKMLSEKMGEAFSNLKFECDYYGKPFLPNSPIKLAFNISHTPGLIVMAVAQEAEMIGIDTENTTREIDLNIRKSVFTDDELYEFDQLPTIKQKNRFYDLWTLKESYMKAIGKGFYLSPKSFRFLFRNKQYQFQENPLESAAQELCFQLFDIDKIYKFAVCHPKGFDQIKAARILPGWEKAEFEPLPTMIIR